jgi:transcriptional regulator with XRE-family HTH domain
MERDEAKIRGEALRLNLQSRLPVPGADSVSGLARKAGLRPSTVSAWWSRGTVPDGESLRLLAGALGVETSELVSAYEGSSGRNWVFTDPELEALIDRVTEVAVRRVLAEQKAVQGE